MRVGFVEAKVGGHYPPLSSVELQTLDEPGWCRRKEEEERRTTGTSGKSEKGSGCGGSLGAHLEC